MEIAFIFSIISFLNDSKFHDEERTNFLNTFYKVITKNVLNMANSPDTDATHHLGLCYL